MVLVYVAFNLHKLYLNQHIVLQFACFTQHFCSGNLYILITQLHILYFNCSRACYHIPYSSYLFPIDGHFAQIFFYFFVIYYYIFYFFYANNVALKSYFPRHTGHYPVVEKMLRLSIPVQMQLLSLYPTQNTELNTKDAPRRVPALEELTVWM